MLVGIDAVVVASQKYSFALTLVFRFYNESLGLTLVKLLFKLFHVTW